jgi:glycosyltransferase involved in cell wall biosynthesis
MPLPPAPDDPIAEASAPGHVLMTADAVGGVLPYALDLAGGLAARGVETTLVLLGPPPDAAQKLAMSRVPGLQPMQTDLPLDWLASDGDAARRAAAAIAGIAGRRDVALVHLNTPSLACADYGVPVVSMLHSCLASWWASVRGGPMPDDFRWRTELISRGIACSDALVCPSAALAGEVERIYGRRPRVVHNGRAAPPNERAEGAGAFAFTAGRLWDEGKGIATLETAAARTDLPILAAGPVEGPNGARIALRELQALGSIRSSEIRALLARQPIYVSTALYEPFGLAVLEAAQAGCALVLSDIATFRELWDGAALFVPPGDGEGFARALTGLRTDRAQRTRLGAAARERAGRYTVEGMAARMIEIYAGVAKRAPVHEGEEAAA